MCITGNITQHVLNMIPDKLQLCDDEDKGQVFTESQSDAACTTIEKLMISMITDTLRNDP